MTFHVLSIALVHDSENAAPYTIEKNEFITEAGAFRFHKITNSEKSLEFEINERGSTQFLIIYTSSVSANNALAVKALNAAACLDQAVKECNISELDGESKIVLNDNGGYSVIGGNNVSLDKAVDTLKHAPLSALRVTQVRNVPLIIELSIERHKEDKDLDLIQSLNACLQAIIQKSTYIPYRDSPLSKLLWSVLAGKVESFTSVCVLDTDRAVVSMPVLSLSANLFELAQLDRLHLDAVYAPILGANRVGPKHKLPSIHPEISLKESVRDAAHELARLYEQELTRVEADYIRKKHEHEVQVACKIHALSRMKDETLSGLKKEIHCLETQLSVARHQQDSRRYSEARAQPETWFSEELRRKCELKNSLIHQRSQLLEALAEAEKFEVSEPIKGIIRQSEFNLKILKMRVEAAELTVE